jgi:uncharacterized membrane protein
MFKSIGKTLLTGIITVLPVLLTIYLLFWMIGSSERIMGQALKWVLPSNFYFPGLGVIAGVLLLFIVGLLMKAYVVRQLFAFGEDLLLKLPFIKSIYRSLRDFFDFLSPKDKKPGQVVAVNLNGMEMIGLVTQEDPQRLPESFRDQDKVMVYFPMSYMIGGFTLFIPRDAMRPLKMGKDEAIRFVMTAGITGKNKDK